MSACEWSPDRDAPAWSNEPPHGPATVNLHGYGGGIHLCAACAALPRFKRFKARPLPPPRTP